MMSRQAIPSPAVMLLRTTSVLLAPWPAAAAAVVVAVVAVVVALLADLRRSGPRSGDALAVPPVTQRWPMMVARTAMAASRVKRISQLL